jgi:hypothetical protein
MLEPFFATSQRLIARTPTTFTRYLYGQIDWRQPLIVLVGMRGVGKTTLLLQHLKQTYNLNSQGLYISADDINLAGTRLVDIAEEFTNNVAGKTLVLDEIHKYPNWNQELKNISDAYPDLKVIASGSSSLDILKGQYDLSRRSLVYQLPHLSLREFINLSLGLNLDSYPLVTILENHPDLASDIEHMLKQQNVTSLERFNQYLRYGSYPYFQNKDVFDFYRQVINAVNKVIYEDISSSFNTSAQAAPTLQRLLNLLTSSEPFTPNVDAIARNLGISRETTYNYLDYLEKSSLTHHLRTSGSGAKAVRKPAKIYLATPTLYSALGQINGIEVKQGTLRESFFLSQLHSYKVTAHEARDFIIQTKPAITFEVGGKGKSRQGLEKNTYLAIDDLSYGVNHTIPLWLFGFLY